MGYHCDYCREARSMVYCPSDEAYLCLSCDRNVHSANALSRRHSRTLVCDRCNIEPALVRCVEEKLSFCQSCDWEVHNGSEPGSGSHSRQTLSCYSGCPSAGELLSIWFFMSDAPSVIDNTCEQDLSDGLLKGMNSNAWMGSSVIHGETRRDDSSTSKVLGPKGCDKLVDDKFYDELNMDEVDLSIENYEELFGVGHNVPEHLFAKDGINGLFGRKETSVAESSCRGAYAAKESLNTVQPACSNAASAGDYQDCGASSVLLMGEPPWCTPAHECTTPSAIRNDAVLGYKEKKKMRKFEKRVRYATRKARADVRKRVKGRFVKAGDAYDYDPMSQT